MRKNRRRAAAAALLILFTGCRSLDEKPSDTYVLQEIAFLNDRASSAAVEAECPVLPAIEKSLIDAGAKLGIAVVKVAEASDKPNRLTVLVDEVVGGRFGASSPAARVSAQIRSPTSPPAIASPAAPTSSA